MIKLNKYIQAPILLLAIILLTSCGKNRSNEIVEAQHIQRWIYSTMEENYFWNEDIPEETKLDFFAEPSSFFNKLLSPKDGKRIEGGQSYAYSYIVNTDKKPGTKSLRQPEYSYGFDFRGIITNIEEKNQILAQLFYTLPNSPASKAGLKRGDLIKAIDQKPLTEGSLANLIGGEAINIEFYRPLPDGSLNLLKVKLEDAVEVENNPIFMYKKISNKTGYLVYNHFTASKNENDNEYNNQLKALSNYFNGVEDFILDLRYNNGGLVSTAELLHAILAPTNQLKNSPGYLLYRNDKKVAMDTPEKRLGSDGTNLDLKRLFIITSSTTASASELIINSLKPFIEVHVIGETTEGKNVGSLGYTRENWEMHPIVCKVYNSIDQSDYSGGFEPGIHTARQSNAIKEYQIQERLNIGELGEESDPLLQKVLQYMAILPKPKTDTRTTIKETKFKVLGSSIDKRRTNNLIVNPLEN